jgi:peptide-N4-(N-acetyl-beta-glucosaminyl)asparagine amidase
VLGCSSFFGLSSNSLKDTLLLYKRVTEQYKNKEILEVVRSLIPNNIALQATKQDRDIVPLMKWFKNDFMRWTPKDPVCERCAGNKTNTKPIPMQAQVIIIGNSWKMRKVEVFKCNNCNYEYTFPRYGQILKIAQTRTGRCSEWSMLFGAILSSLDIETRIVHDFLDHCWNEANLDGKWVHMDSTLDYPISLNHPYYYEENWGKQYEYVLAFSADKVEDVTKRYIQQQQWETIQKRRVKKKENNNKSNVVDFARVYSDI